MRFTKMLKQIAAVAAVTAFISGASAAWAQPAAAHEKKAGLFVNMTSDDVWRGWMGLHFAYRTRDLPLLTGPV